jgi:hypothetical protein
MYKVWQSKQMFGFCGTQARVGKYSGEAFPDKRCPNCGRRETAAHLMLCPDEDRTRLLIENVDKLSKWLDTDSRTDPELAYWIPTYILMRGNKPFLTLGYMSSKLKALAKTSIELVGRTLQKGISLLIFTRFKHSTSRCQAVSSTGQIGPNNSSPRSYKLCTCSGCIKTFCFMTNARATFTIRGQQS